MTVSAAAAETARRLLVGTRVEQLKSSQQNVTILRSTATVDQALRELAKNKILSAPVVVAPEQPGMGSAESGPPTWPHGVASADTLGFVDIRDILCSFLHEIDDLGLGDMNLLHKMRLLEEQGCKFGATQLGALHVMGHDGGFLHSSQAKSSLLELIMYGLLDPRARGMHEGRTQSKVVHRIAFFDKSSCIQMIVSQTDIIRYVVDHLDRLGPLKDESVEALGMVQHQVVSVPPETSAIMAMGVMQEKGVSSLAVVGPSGKIMGNFSMSEMRTIVSEQFGALALPVGEFLAMENRVEYVGHNRIYDEAIISTAGHRFAAERISRKRPHVLGDDVGQELILCAPHNTLGEVMAKMAKHRVHRVYVVDEDEKPVGIITCTDILSKLVEVSFQ